MTALERTLRERGWVRSIELMENSGSNCLALAIMKLDQRSFDELMLDFRSDTYRFFNLYTGEYCSGKTWKDIPLA